MDDVLAAVAAELRAEPAVEPAFDERVMSAVRAHGRVRRAPPWRGLMAAGLVGLAFWAGRRSVPRDSTVAVPTQFVLVAHDAARVHVVGDFNAWDPEATPLRATAGGDVWVATVRLPPGRHEYAFVIDGTRWTLDPGAPAVGDDDFGRPNSVVMVMARS